MTKRNLTFAAVTAVVMLVAVPFAFAQHARRGGEFAPMFFGRIAHLKQALDLSDAQLSQIKAIVVDLRTENAPYRDSLHAGMQTVLQTLINNPNDIAAAQKIIDQQNAAEQALKTNTLNAASKALNVLTAEQRAKLATLVQQHMASHSAR